MIGWSERLDADQFFTGAFVALTDHTPMPWQARLFRTRFVSGNLPSAVSIPTGLGKTAVMAIWLIALAWQYRENRSPVLPRRLVYVVDRRAVVDQSTDFAETLRKGLASPKAAELRAMLGMADDQRLAISTLRGQFVDNRDWLEDPSRPAIVVGTVDMIGSRLLFEGYGVSRKMRPYHAGLLGADALVLLDEAHLVPPFEALLSTIANGPGVYAARSEEDRRYVPTFKLLPLSATSRNAGEDAFALEAQDFNDPDDAGARRTRERLNAAKQLRVQAESATELPKAIAERAWEVAGRGANEVRCLIYCDKREDAEAVHKELSNRADALIRPSKTVNARRASAILPSRPEIELFVGARRVFERRQAQERLETLGFLAGSKKAGSAAFLIATSAGEVGVDLDADHLVCDLVHWERMVQRFGRVNRRGGDGRMAQITVIADAEQEPSRSIKEARAKAEKERSKKEQAAIETYSKEVEKFKARRRPFGEALKASADGLFDVSPGALHALAVRAAVDADIHNVLSTACTPALLRPALSRPLVDAWSMTSLEVHTGRPRVEPWLRGWVDERPQTAVAWREHLPIRTEPPASQKEIGDFFEAAPLQTVELLETETWRVLDWLMQRVATLLDRPVKSSSGEGGEGGETEDAGSDQTVVAMDVSETAASGSELSASSAAPDSSETAGAAACRLQPGDVIGMVFSAGGDYQRTLHVGDLPLQTPETDAQKKRQKAMRDRLEKELASATLVLLADIGGLNNGLLVAVSGPAANAADGSVSWGEGETGKPVIPFRVRDSATGDASLEGDWRECLRFDLERDADGEATRWLIVEEWPDSANTEDRRSNGPEQPLVEHQCWAERCARRIGNQLGLKDAYLEMLATAARLHDEGKKAYRWQSAFRAKRTDGPYAKTKGPIDFKLLDGYRHEFGSLPYAQKDRGFLELPTDLQDLALHLIAAHHGFARPVIGTRGCDDAPPSALEGRAREVALRFARLQRRWGPWGLAWWEALLRAADQQASRENDARGRKPQ